MTLLGTQRLILVHLESRHAGSLGVTQLEVASTCAVCAFSYRSRPLDLMTELQAQVLLEARDLLRERGLDTRQMTF